MNQKLKNDSFLFSLLEVLLDFQVTSTVIVEYDIPFYYCKLKKNIFVRFVVGPKELCSFLDDF